MIKAGILHVVNLIAGAVANSTFVACIKFVAVWQLNFTKPAIKHTTTVSCLL